MTAPTKEQYEKVLHNIECLKNIIIRERERRERVINELCCSHKMLEEYEKLFKDNKDIVEKYEIYQEILKK